MVTVTCSGPTTIRRDAIRLPRRTVATGSARGTGPTTNTFVAPPSCRSGI